MKLILSLLLFTILTAQESFTFIKGNQKIVLKVDDGSKNLIWGKKSILSLILENIDHQKMSMSAPGIKMIKSQNSKIINLEITPDKRIIEKDTLILNIGFKDANKNFFHHHFSIIIKNK